MGYYFLTAPCYVCGRLFTSNPNSVPSFENQPICRPCIERVNEERRKNRLPEWPILPDAYGVAEEIGE